MDLSSFDVLGEVKKYMAIVELCKEAIFRNTKQIDLTDLKEKLEVLISGCQLTNGKGPSDTPLTESLKFLNDNVRLSEELRKAQDILHEILAKIEADVGPFYVPDEILKMNTIGKEKKLEDQIWIQTLDLLVVQTYYDENRNRFIQVDWRHGQYRSSLKNENFGPWRFFMKETMKKESA